MSDELGDGPPEAPGWERLPAKEVYGEGAHRTTGAVFEQRRGEVAYLAVVRSWYGTMTGGEIVMLQPSAYPATVPRRALSGPLWEPVERVAMVETPVWRGKNFNVERQWATGVDPGSLAQARAAAWQEMRPAMAAIDTIDQAHRQSVLWGEPTAEDVAAFASLGGRDPRATTVGGRRLLLGPCSQRGSWAATVVEVTEAPLVRWRGETVRRAYHWDEARREWEVPSEVVREVGGTADNRRFLVRLLVGGRRE